MFDVVTEKLFARRTAIRSYPAEDKTVFLTFDDGPDPDCTPQVLQILQETQAKATFFVVGDRAKQYPHIVQNIVEAGHRLGNHSPDHAYRHFFTGTQAIASWIQSGEDTLQQLSGESTVGFRPPNGICNPRVIRALAQLKQPLILWSCRFYDTVVGWSEKRALEALSQLKNGDIILLHDRQSASSKELFLSTLEKFIREGQKQNWKFAALPKKIKSDVLNRRDV